MKENLISDKVGGPVASQKERLPAFPFTEHHHLEKRQWSLLLASQHKKHNPEEKIPVTSRDLLSLLIVGRESNPLADSDGAFCVGRGSNSLFRLLHLFN
jgi:hypothetical protein